MRAGKSARSMQLANSSRSPPRLNTPGKRDPSTIYLTGSVPSSNRRRVSVCHMRMSRSMGKIGRAHVCTPVTNAHLVCRLLLEKQQLYTINTHYRSTLHTQTLHYYQQYKT